MTHYLIGLGSNINPEENIRLAISHLGNFLTIRRQATVLRTEPVGYTAQPEFLNTAVLAESELDPAELKVQLQQIERDLGRQPSANKNGPRPIDLDILVVDDRIADEDVYTRPFLAAAVRELLPELAALNL